MPRSFRVPPVAHLRKARSRLDRLRSHDIEPQYLAVGKGKLPPIEKRRPYANDLSIVLRDYDRLLNDLLGESDE